MGILMNKGRKSTKKKTLIFVLNYFLLNFKSTLPVHSDFARPVLLHLLFLLPVHPALAWPVLPTSSSSSLYIQL
jgi:hypothetical protein